MQQFCYIDSTTVATTGASHYASSRHNYEYLHVCCGEPYTHIHTHTLAYLHQQKSRYEGASLTVADLPVKDGVSLEHVKKALLAQTVPLLEE